MIRFCLWRFRIRDGPRLVSHGARDSCGCRALAPDFSLDLRDSLVERVKVVVELRIHDTCLAQLTHQRLPRALVDIVARGFGRLVGPVDPLSGEGGGVIATAPASP